ncbi:MAG: toprim domain-containing protein, partial [Hyphomicrobiaceae bacterium]
EDQLRLMWRMNAEPVLCFDGDSAGRKAAHRAIDTAVPHLKPGQSLTFAFLPDGLDPDDLIRQQGPAAMEAVLARARPLADVLFEREWAAGDWDTPERRARLEQRIREIVGRIADGAVRSQYERDMRQRLYEAWGGARGSRPRPVGHAEALRHPVGASGYGSPVRRGQTDRSFPVAGSRNRTTGHRLPLPARAAASEALRQSALVAGEAAAPPYRELLLLRTLVNHPWLAADEAETLARLTLTSGPLDRLRRAILSAVALDIPLDRANLRTQLDVLGARPVLDLVERSITHRSDKFAEIDASKDEVEAGWRHTLALHESHVDLRDALAAAEREWHEDGNEQALARIREIQRQMALVNERGGLDGHDGTA